MMPRIEAQERLAAFHVALAAGNRMMDDEDHKTWLDALRAQVGAVAYEGATIEGLQDAGVLVVREGPQGPSAVPVDPEDGQATAEAA